MKFFAVILPAFGFIACVGATWSNQTTIWTTRTVQTLTTYCPEATTITHGTKTYTATAHETLTITDCPCTIKHPIKNTHTPIPPPDPSHPLISSSMTAESSGITKITNPPIQVTLTVSEYTTFCPYPTTIPVGLNSTITVTKPTTLTLSLCPCTLTKPAIITTALSYTTTFCPEPTTLTIGTQTRTVPAGTVTIPVEYQTTVPSPETTHQTLTKTCTEDQCQAPPPASTKQIESQAPVPSTTTPPTYPAGTGSTPSYTTRFLTANDAATRETVLSAVFAACAFAAFL